MGREDPDDAAANGAHEGAQKDDWEAQERGCHHDAGDGDHIAVCYPFFERPGIVAGQFASNDGTEAGADSGQAEHEGPC